MSHSGLSHPVFAGNQDSTSSATGPLASMFGAADIANSNTINSEQTSGENASASASAQSAQATASTAHEAMPQTTSDDPVRHGSAAQAPPVRQPAGTARSGARVSSEPRVRSKRSLDSLQSGTAMVR